MSQGLNVYFMHFKTLIMVSCDIGDTSRNIFITIGSLPRSLKTSSLKSRKSDKEMLKALQMLSSVRMFGILFP